jgi:CobQ-like glutamine amidotransferase family enzyme
MDNAKYEGLKIFDYYAKQNPKRIVGESFMEFENLTPIIGFQNRCSVMQCDDNHLFSVINGYADNYKSSFEGYRENNFFGTYLIGPLLIRNPHFTDYIVKDILEKKNIPYTEITNTIEYKAYNEYLKNFYDL